MYACKDGHKDVVQLLLELEHSALNVELNARSNDGSTAYMWACAKGRKDVVQLLLVHSSKIELYAQDVSGRTALMDACDNGHKDIVQLLLNHSNKIQLKAKSESPNREYGQQNHILLFSSTAEILLMYFSHTTYPQSY